MTSTPPDDDRHEQPSTAALRQDLEAMLDLLRERRLLLESGHLVDFGGLDTRVAEACRAATALPAGQARDLVPLLSAIGEELTALDAEYRRRLKAPEPDRAGSRRAAEAYAGPTRERR